MTRRVQAENGSWWTDTGQRDPYGACVFVVARHAGTQHRLRDLREMFGMVPREIGNHAFDRLLPRGVRARTWDAVSMRGAPVGWALAYAITRGLRNAVWLVRR